MNRLMMMILAGSALSVWMKCIPLAAGEMRYATLNVRVPANKAKDTDEKNLAWAKKVWAKHKSGGYESATSAFGPSVADDLIAGQLELLGRLYR